MSVLITFLVLFVFIISLVSRLPPKTGGKRGTGKVDESKKKKKKEDQIVYKA